MLFKHFAHCAGLGIAILTIGVRHLVMWVWLLWWAWLVWVVWFRQAFPDQIFVQWFLCFEIYLFAKYWSFALLVWGYVGVLGSSVHLFGALGQDPKTEVRFVFVGAPFGSSWGLLWGKVGLFCNNLPHKVWCDLWLMFDWYWNDPYRLLALVVRYCWNVGNTNKNSTTLEQRLNLRV